MTTHTVDRRKSPPSSWVLAPASHLGRLAAWESVVDQLEPNTPLLVVPGDSPRLQFAARCIHRQLMRSGRKVATLSLGANFD
jgi:hypothetical protein